MKQMCINGNIIFACDDDDDEMMIMMMIMIMVMMRMRDICTAGITECYQNVSKENRQSLSR